MEVGSTDSGLFVLLHGTKRLLQIKIKVACPCPAAALGTGKIYWTRGGKKRLTLSDAVSNSFYNSFCVSDSTVCSFS